MARKLFISSALALAAAVLLGACKATDTAGNTSASQAAGRNGAAGQSAPAAGTTAVSADGARRVTVAELQQMVEAGTAVVYDTRTKGAYDAEHIKGALLMPSNEVGDHAGELPQGKTLVFYCT
jgi:hypothetical protein